MPVMIKRLARKDISQSGQHVTPPKAKQNAKFFDCRWKKVAIAVSRHRRLPRRTYKHDVGRHSCACESAFRSEARAGAVNLGRDLSSLPFRVVLTQ
jgi:hypothetical protein